MTFVQKVDHSSTIIILTSSTSSAFKDPVAGDYFQYMYAVTHMRAGPYVVGVATGFLLYRLSDIPTQIPMVCT